MPDISTAERGISTEEVPLMIDNKTFEILERSRADTPDSRLEQHLARAVDIAVAWGGPVEVPAETVLQRHIGTERAGSKARERGANGTKLLVTSAGAVAIVRSLSSADPMEERRIRLRRVAEEKASAKASQNKAEAIA